MQNLQTSTAIIQNSSHSIFDTGRRSARQLISSLSNIQDDCGSSHMASDVVFEGYRSSEHQLSPEGDHFQGKLVPSSSNLLQVKMRKLAQQEAKQLIDEELVRRTSDSNMRIKMARKLIIKKQHQILISEVNKRKAFEDADTIASEIELLEGKFRMGFGGLLGCVIEINNQINVDNTIDEQNGFDKAVVHTEWTEQVDETEQLLELPHPVPVKPEISPSFIESNSHKDDETEDNFMIYNEQQSQQVSPVPSKKPEKFSNQKLSSDQSSDVKKSSFSKLKIQKAFKNPSPSARGARKNIILASPDLQQSQSPYRQNQKTKNRSDNKGIVSHHSDDEYFAVEHPRGISSQGFIQNKSNQKPQITTKLQDYMSSSKEHSGSKNALRASIPELKGLSQLRQNIDSSAKKSARSSNTISRNLQNQGQHIHHHTVNHTSRHSIVDKTDIHSNHTGKRTDEPATARTANKNNDQIKADPNISAALSQISARTFQAFLSKRYQNYDLAYMITLISALYEDSIPMNSSQTDLIYKNNWDDISRQLFNAARIIRSLTKLKYSASSDAKSEFIKKLVKIQYAKKFESFMTKFDQSQLENQSDNQQTTRMDYSFAVRSLYNVLQAINELYLKAMGHTYRFDKPLGSGSDFDGISNPGNYLVEIEEKSDANSTHLRNGGGAHRRTSSIPRQLKPQNRVQAVKIDLALPLNLGAGNSRQQNGANNFTSVNSARKPATSHTQLTPYTSRNNEQTFSQTKSSMIKQTHSNFTNALAQKISLYSTNRGNKNLLGHASQQLMQGQTSRNIAGGIDRSSLIEPQTTSDINLSSKSPHQSGKVQKVPQTAQKTSLNQQYQERLKRQAQFQQSLSDFITREQQAKKLQQQAKNNLLTQPVSQGIRQGSNSFLKPKESPLNSGYQAPQHISQSANQAQKSFLKFQPVNPISSFHSPSLSTAQVTFGAQGQVAQTFGNLNQIQTPMSNQARIRQETPSGIKPPTVLSHGSQHKLPPFNPSQGAIVNAPTFPKQINTIKEMIHSSTPSSQGKNRQVENSGGIIGSQHEDKLRRHMQVLLKLAEPVRSKVNRH